MYKPLRKTDVSTKVKGWLALPIQFEVRVPTSDWSPLFGDFTDQRFGMWDSDSCWALASINSVEDQLEWLYKNNMFSVEAINFFTTNGYLDSKGDFSLSERFHEILCGQLDKGGTVAMATQSFQKRGFIPRPMLTYTPEQANSHSSREDFNNDYFNSKYVTSDMLALGVQSLKYINIAYQYLDKSLNDMRAALQQAPICIGIPVPINWNTPFVQYNGDKSLDHEVELYAIDDKGQSQIFDQYEPHLKTLSADYYIGVLTQIIVYARNPISVNPIPQPPTNPWYTTFFNWVNNALKSFTFT